MSAVDARELGDMQTSRSKDPDSSDNESSPAMGDKDEEQSLVQQVTKSYWFPVGVLAVVIFIGVLINEFFFRGDGMALDKAAVREKLPPGMNQCLIYGDPHVANYDHTKPEPSFHGAGEYWLTRTADGSAVKIQGQFSIPSLTSARTALTHIAISGDFIGGRKIVIGPLNGGDIRLDGVPIMTGFPSAYFLPNGMGTFTYNDVGVEVDDVTFGWDKKVVTLRFTRGVSLSIFRWTDYLDARIRMPANVPLSGVCGNNNGAGEDDTTEAVYSIGGVRVGEGQSLFYAQVNTALSDAAKLLLAKCTPELMTIAQEVCVGMPDENQKQQCEIDVCTGTEEHDETQVGEAAQTNPATQISA